MSIKTNTGFLNQSATFLDSRQSVTTLDDLLALDTNIIPNGFECYVEELDCKYKYHKDYNEVGTGNWKLKIGGSGSGEENKIDSISINGSPITPDENKNVDITVPDAYDDTALVQKISDIESDYAKSSDIPSLSGYATETWVNEQGFLTQHQDISGLQTKTDDKLATTSKEVVGAINEVKDMADLILDTEVCLDKTYSSSKIYSAIQDAIDSSKNFTLAEIEKMSGASYKVVTSTAEMTDGKIIYLLENGSTYDMYIVEEAGTVTKIGDTAIDLSSYLKTTDAESTYLKKTDATITYVAQTSFNNHITDTVAHLTQFEKNKLLTTDKVINTLTSTDTNKPLSANQGKVLKELLDNKVNKTDIVDNLTSTDIDKPLSANQGKILNDTKLNKTDANKLDCVSIDNVSLKEYILTNFTERGKTYYLIAKTTCTDLPKASNFYITVETPGLYTYKVTAKELNDSNGSYVCTYRTISSSWTAWEKVLITGDITTTDSEVVKKIYIKDTSSQDARTLIQNHWSEFDNFEFYNLHIDTAKWAWDAEIYAHTQEYGTVLLRSYGSDVPSVFYGKLYSGVWTWQELATMDKVNALHKKTTGSITGSLLGSVVKNANLYYQKFGDNRLVINGWVGVDAVSARTPIFTLPNNWKANSNYLLPCYVVDSNVACACVIDIEKGTVNSYTPLPATSELKFCGEIYII